MNMHDETQGNPKVRTRFYEFVVAGIVFLIFSIYFSFGAISSYVRQLKAGQSFMPVSAIIVSAQIGTHGGNRVTHGTSFYPAIVYRYSVGGKEYQSDRYFFTGNGWPDQASAQKVVERYSSGAAVQAYVNPDDAWDVVLDASRPSPRMFLFLIPFWIFSVGVIYYGIRGRIKS